MFVILFPDCTRTRLWTSLHLFAPMSRNMSGNTSKMLHGKPHSCIAYHTTRQVLCGTFKTQNEYPRSASIAFRLFRCVISEFIRFIHGLSYVEADVTGKKEYKLAKSGSKQQPNMIVGYKKKRTAKQVVQFDCQSPNRGCCKLFCVFFLMVHRMSDGSERPLVFCSTK